MIFRISNVWLILHLTQQSASIRNFQQSFLHEISNKRGYVCSSSTDVLHKVESRILCAVFLRLEEGADIFTFDYNAHTCRIYREEEFNGCLFQACSSCVTFRYNELETTTTANTGPVTTVQTTQDLGPVTTEQTTQGSVVSCVGLHGDLLPHPTDCSKFYECVHSAAVLRVCAVSLHFDASRNMCDYPANVNCPS